MFSTLSSTLAQTSLPAANGLKDPIDLHMLVAVSKLNLGYSVGIESCRVVLGYGQLRI